MTLTSFGRIQSSLASIRQDWTPVEQLTWALVFFLFIGGDMATTAIGLSLGAVELSPGGLYLTEHLGVLGAMLTGKTIMLAFVAGCFTVSPWEYRVLFPSTLAAIGALVVGYNTYIILKLTGLV